MSRCIGEHKDKERESSSAKDALCESLSGSQLGNYFCSQSDGVSGARYHPPADFWYKSDPRDCKAITRPSSSLGDSDYTAAAYLGFLVPCHCSHCGADIWLQGSAWCSVMPGISLSIQHREMSRLSHSHTGTTRDNFSAQKIKYIFVSLTNEPQHQMKQNLTLHNPLWLHNKH